MTSNSPAADAVAIPLFEPDISGREWEYVKECLDTGWVSSAGAFVDRFESAMAAHIGARYAVATASGTAALHVALLVAGVEPDDEVIVSGLTFVAPANAIRYVGAHPVFIDAEPQYWQMDPALVERFLAEECVRAGGGDLRNLRTGRRVRALLPIHILGHACDVDRLVACARTYGLRVIEDASESLGATYRGRRIGCDGDVACFSFNGNKIVTSGGGGMIMTNDEACARRARYLTTQAKDDPIEYVHHEIGYNYRLTNVQAAIGLAQLERLESVVTRKRRIAAAYAEAIRDCAGLRPHPAASWSDPTYWLYTITVDEAVAGLDSRALLRRFAAVGVQTRPLWHPLPGLRPFAGCHVEGGDCMNRLYRDALSLPSSSTLTPAQQQRVIDVLRRPF